MTQCQFTTDNPWYAWAAGVFDGEGTFHIASHNNKKSWHIRASVPQASFDDNPPRMIVRLQELFGGVIAKKKVDVPSRLPMWSWRIDNRAGVRAFADAVWPWLGPEKRAQFERCWEKVTFINQSPHPRVIVNCGVCGESFSAAPCSHRKYCSRACYRTTRQRDMVTGRFT